MNRSKKVIGWGVAALVAAAPAAGGKLTSDPTWTLHFENDLFTGTDRFYTNGARIARVGSTETPPWWSKPAAGRFENGGYDLFRGSFLTHVFYTPEDIAEPRLIVDDRPYAGWVYYTSALEARSETSQHRLEASLGLVGEAAFAEEIQKFVHREVSHSTEPRGWDNQLDNEPVLLLFYRYRRTVSTLQWWHPDGDLLFFDATPHLTAALGNVFTYGGAGFTVRLGYNLPPGFASSIEPVAAGPSLAGTWAAHLFASVEGRGVLRNLFLDGNTFEDSHSVDKETWVADLSLGATVRYKRWSVTYQAKTRSREFDLQNRRQSWGALSVSISPRLAGTP